MALSILNNIPSLVAQNQLTMTSASMQTTLFRLSSGSRINSGADDAAGLAIADGLRANITALTQSSRNATDGIGKLQVADGALSQASNLLNRAVTLATEAATGTVTDTQRIALNTEFTSIKAELTRIGQKTTYNGSTIFNSSAAQTDKNTIEGSATGLAGTDVLAAGTLVMTDSDTGKSYSFTANGTTDTVDDLIADMNSNTNINVKASLDGGKFKVADANGNGSLMVVSNGIGTLGTVAAQTLKDPNQFVSANAPGVAAFANGATFTVTDSDSGKSYTFTGDGAKTVTDLIAGINGSSNISATASLDSNGKLLITDKNGNGSLSVINGLNAVLGNVDRPNQTGSASTDIYLSDGTSVGGGSISVSIGQLSESKIGFGTNSVDLSLNDLLNQDNANAALTKINTAIANVAADRGTLGAAINRLSAAGSVISSQIQNLSAAEDGIRSADIAKEVANLTKFTILNQTGISALAQANQMQQSVLKLLQ